MRKSKYLFASLVLLCFAGVSNAQDFGLSFSYFIPKNGEFSTPISPFSIRGVGVDINRYLALETGASLYRMSGLNLKDLPFESKKSLIGPNFTILIPAELVIQLKGSRVEFDIKGGGFFFFGFAHKINYGNLDRAIRDHEQWDVANADVSFKNNPGFGYHAGAELTVFVTSQFGISLETNYLVGAAKFPLTGSYTGGTSATFETKPIDYKDAKIDMTGLEFSIGLIFSSGNSAPKRPKQKRRR
ncbi:hypothetical protein [Chryseosolibacter indicus]|uniref:Outer membrane protein beta-barrel domain-containing protein n=1 Tax=Chryseosolibacter indicus TaxID=2782351 RepID=A0ABS5VTG9_9BACT|nr:hypothetical protein [Chryseosolibacter indicus]MBT1704725.1 hypothetical protein [Chryseosolibacter indicus]